MLQMVEYYKYYRLTHNDPPSEEQRAGRALMSSRFTLEDGSPYANVPLPAPLAVAPRLSRELMVNFTRYLCLEDEHGVSLRSPEKVWFGSLAVRLRRRGHRLELTASQRAP